MEPQRDPKMDHARLILGDHFEISNLTNIDTDTDFLTYDDFNFGGWGVSLSP